MVEPAPSFAFDADTRVEYRTAGVFDTTLTGRWHTPMGSTNGGYLLAVCLRALLHDISGPDPLVAAASFLRPGQAGPAEVRTEVVRTGRRVSTGEARLLQNGAEVVRVVAGFTDFGQRSGPEVQLVDRPELPAPEDALELPRDPRPPGLTLDDRFEYRTARVPGWMLRAPSGDPTAVLWMRFADGRPADTLTLPLLVDCIAPVVFELGEFGSSTTQLTVHVRGRPAPGWLTCRVITRHVSAGFHEEDCDVWDSAGRLVAQSRQLAVLGSGS